jgi:type IV pilus assembly protein PilE
MKSSTGFTLIETMIVVVIVGILMAIGLPAYQGNVLRSHRADAHSSLLNIASRQERFVAQRNTYTTAIAAAAGLNLGSVNSPEGYYTLEVKPLPCNDISVCYLIEATAVGGQTSDTGCTLISYDSAGTKSPVDCW